MMIHVKVANNGGLVGVYFDFTGTGPRVDSESNILSANAILWDLMPVGMAGIDGDGDEVFSEAMRRQVSAKYERNAVDVE